MIFSDKIYPKPVVPMILNGEKTQTRRLVKEDDWTDCQTKNGSINGVWSVKTGITRTKWQVGRDYCVQTGRGKPGLVYCPKCKDFYYNTTMHARLEYCKPFRIKLLDIRKPENLINISEKDALAEGFPKTDWSATHNYIEAFMNANRQYVPKEYKRYFKIKGQNWTQYIAGQWNPEVWPLTFEVLK